MRNTARKDSVITIRVNEEQKMAIKCGAKAQRMSMSDYILNCVMSPKIAVNEQERVVMEMTLVKLQMLMNKTERIRKILGDSEEVTFLGQESLDAMIGDIKRAFEILKQEWGLNLYGARMSKRERAQIDYPDKKLVEIDDGLEGD
jgi:uncharacterized protein (DUF1778 family)